MKIRALKLKTQRKLEDCEAVSNKHNKAVELDFEFLPVFQNLGSQLGLTSISITPPPVAKLVRILTSPHPSKFSTAIFNVGEIIVRVKLIKYCAYPYFQDDCFLSFSLGLTNY